MHENLLNNLVSGVVAITPKDKISVFNRSAERILNIERKQVMGRDVRFLQADLSGLLLDTLHHDKCYSRREVKLIPGNTLIGASTSQFHDSRGGLLGACMVFSNLARIKQNERKLSRQRMNHYWANVADSLANEVRNSIVAAKVLTEMFPQKYSDAEFRWNLYSTLKRDMHKLERFAENLLDFAHSPELVIQPCRIDELLDAAVDELFAEVSSAHIEVSREYASGLKPVLGDYHRLKEAFSALLTNAAEAMQGKGSLELAVEQESTPQMLIYTLPEAVNDLPPGPLAVVRIKDSGRGIAPEDMPRLFDPFFTTKPARSGLGLSRARKIVQRHRGMIYAESKPDEGALFWICLPNQGGENGQTKNPDY